MPELCLSALSTRAAQPTWCRSSLPGSSVDGSRCAKMAMTGAVRLSTSSTSATDFSRPTSNGRHGAREEDRVADGQDRQLVAELDGLIFLTRAGLGCFFSDMSGYLSVVYALPRGVQRCWCPVN